MGKRGGGPVEGGRGEEGGCVASDGWRRDAGSPPSPRAAVNASPQRQHGAHGDSDDSGEGSGGRALDTPAAVGGVHMYPAAARAGTSRPPAAAAPAACTGTTSAHLPAAAAPLPAHPTGARRGPLAGDEEGGPLPPRHAWRHGHDGCGSGGGVAGGGRVPAKRRGTRPPHARAAAQMGLEGGEEGRGGWRWWGGGAGMRWATTRTRRGDGA